MRDLTLFTLIFTIFVLSASFSLPLFRSLSPSSMAATSVSCSFRPSMAPARICSLKSAAFSVGFPSLRLQKGSSRLQVLYAAKTETVDKVCEIVRKQLAIAPKTDVSGDSKFAALGADSLDTVEIVMGLEEEFGISVEEESAQSIVTVQDAADMIEELIEKKGA